MLAIITTHPIQYQVPIFQYLKQETKIPFEVWFLSDHGVKKSYDKQFGESFAWDLDLLSGYDFKYIKVNKNFEVNNFFKLRVKENLGKLFKENGITHVWIQGWQVYAYWQIVYLAKKYNIKIILRAETNDLAKHSVLKRVLKYFPMNWFINSIDHFLYIGNANKRFYKKFGVSDSQLLPGPYCIDNDRFNHQYLALKKNRAKIRRKWGIKSTSYCILFAGKFISKKKPEQLVEACKIIDDPSNHLLMVGNGELRQSLIEQSAGLSKTFTGFLNQKEIIEAYIAADLLVLPSDTGETWGLVVNEAMACRLPCIVADSCGCAEDLVKPLNEEAVVPCDSIGILAEAIKKLKTRSIDKRAIQKHISNFHLKHTVHSVQQIYSMSIE